MYRFRSVGLEWGLGVCNPNEIPATMAAAPHTHTRGIRYRASTLGQAFRGVAVGVRALSWCGKSLSRQWFLNGQKGFHRRMFCQKQIESL